ncbi:MAG: radical SAM protein [Deltaproteobacteria bacterium]|nr:radical SAM protein [Deltaproteobacteria bacterium]
MPTKLLFYLEVAGCLTSCQHCWARGRPYANMPLQEIAWVLEQAHRACTDAGLVFDVHPMHELLAHPHAVEVIRLFKAMTSPERFSDSFHPIPTTGVPLAVREDWQPMLEAVRDLGATTIWVTFHGADDVHDAAVNRLGAFRETCLAVERAHTMGFQCGCNIFVTKENVGQFDELVATFQGLSVDGMFWDIARYHPIVRVRRREAVRPELEDLLPVAERIVQLSPFYKDKWAHLESYTEAAYVRQAMVSSIESGPPWEYPPLPDTVEVVCRGNLDVYGGQAGLYGRRLGSLRADGVAHVVQTAIEVGPCPVDSLHFSTDALPSIQSLAEQVGNAHGRKVYFHAPDIRQRWLDLALAEYRRY